MNASAADRNAPGRRFARLQAGSRLQDPGYWPVPGNGLCLSTFLVLEAPDRPGHVLMGRIDPAASWYELGALTPERIAALGDRWVLPASQLLFFEDLQASAERIAREQLNAPLPPLADPIAFSESSPRTTPESTDPHWDIHFLFRGRWPTARPPRSPVWRELAFVDVAGLARGGIGRNQADVLDLVGLTARGSASAPTSPGRTRRP